MNCSVHSSSGDPKKLIDLTSTSKINPPESEFPAVEGTPDVNDENDIPVKGTIPDLVNAFLKTAIRTEKSSSHSLSNIDRAEILAIATQITENILKYSSTELTSPKPGMPVSAVNVFSGSKPGGGSSFANGSEEPLVDAASGGLEEGEIEVENPDGALTIPRAPVQPVSTATTKLPVAPTVSFQAAKSGEEPSAPLSYSEATAGNSDGVLGTVDFSSGIPTVIFTKNECEQVSSYYRFALIGKFSYG
ncbi:hypothetical protein OROMI_013306 [Orobanche minor]